MSSGEVSAARAARAAEPWPSSSLMGWTPSGQPSAGGSMTKMCCSSGSSAFTFSIRSRKPASSTIAMRASAWCDRYWISSGEEEL
ncbi:unannotated protein [freshwater metagenome]|uniref:Unannotated protein n=1 Tax=freshwater metagenome TaxID=449393 RepID=A0A6J6GES7_9ZZZZ